MKKILSLTFGLLLIASFAFAASDVTFTWDANTEADLAGYKLYQSQTSGNYTTVPVSTIPAGTETVTLYAIPDGTYYWVLTAYDTAGNESGYSNEVTASLDSTAPEPPSNFLINLIKKIAAWFKSHWG